MTPDLPAIHCPAPIPVDGDTIRCGRQRIRIARIQAPDHPRSAPCRKRRPGYVCDPALYEASKSALAGMLSRGPARLIRVDCSPQRAGVQLLDPYRRPCVRVIVRGRDVGEAMVRGGYARRWP